MSKRRAPRGVIGVVHVPPMPGDPRHEQGGFGEVERFAMADAEALVAGGVDAIIIENFGSAPFSKGVGVARIPPHQIALLTLLVRSVASLGVSVGVNCLRNDARSALGIAAVAGASFVRVNIHSGAYVTDQGLIEGEADETLRYRSSIGASHVAILADVLVKHASPLAPLTATDATHDVVTRGLADAVIVTGRATGAPVDRALLEEVSHAAHGATVLLGSGLTPALADSLAPLAHGAIVGSWLKRDGVLEAPVDAARVKELIAAVRGKFLAST
ncbi:MAG: BtpA/SgcQ family protein [Polyangiaceae bacterium]